MFGKIKNLSDDLSSLCFVLLAHNLHVSQLAFTRRKYYYSWIPFKEIVRETNIGLLVQQQNYIFADQNRSPSPSPAPPQWVSSPRPKSLKLLMFAGKSWVIIRSQQSAKLCQSFWTHGEVQVSIEAFLCIYECQAYFGEWLIWAITAHRDSQDKCQKILWHDLGKPAWWDPQFEPGHQRWLHYFDPLQHPYHHLLGPCCVGILSKGIKQGIELLPSFLLPRGRPGSRRCRSLSRTSLGHPTHSSRCWPSPTNRLES